MTTKKVYIAPEVEVFTVKQESPLMAGTMGTDEGDNTGGGRKDPPKVTDDFAKQTSFSLWDENDEDNGGLWDE